MRLLRRIVLTGGLLGVLCGGVVAFGQVDDAHACVPQSQYACNEPEREARQKCLDVPAATGAMWFSSNRNNYFDTAVNVSHNATSATIYLRGSVWPCGSTKSGGTSADRISIQRWMLPPGRTEDGTPRRPDPRFGGYRPGATTLYRGNYASNGNRWTSQGHSVPITVDLRGIPMNNSATPVTHSMDIGLWRRYVDATSTGESYATRMTLRIVRSARPITWSITPSATITSGASINQPGQDLQWRHRIRNNGPDRTNKAVTYRGQNQGSLGSNNVTARTESNIPAGHNRDHSSTHTISQGNVGTNLCRRTLAQPRAHNNGGIAYSGQACRYIPYNFSLTPSTEIASGDGYVIEDPRAIGAAVKPISGSIAHDSGNTKSYQNTRWRLTQLIFNSSSAAAAKNGGGTQHISSGDAAGFRDGIKNYFGASEAASLSDGTIAAAINKGGLADIPSYNGNISIPDDLPIGGTVCYVLSINRHRHATGSDAANASGSAMNSQWRHSHLQCVIVGKKPRVQIHGGSLQAGRSFAGESLPVGNNANVDTGVTTMVQGGQPRTFGSWSEYGIYAPAMIRGMASNSGLSPNHSSGNQSSWSQLSFTRMVGPQYGQYISSNPTLPRIESAFPVTALTSRLANGSTMTPRQLAGVSTTSSAAQGRTVTVDGTGNLTIRLSPTGAGGLTAGQWAVVNAPNANVTISGAGGKSIEYRNGSYSKARDIPQLIIIARTITINSDVERIDAWLVAKDALSTCNQRGNATQLSAASKATYMSTASSASYTLQASHCNRQLQVNGPVMAGKLFLRRTFGAERATAGDPDRPSKPAETFNFRPDAYLWAHNRTLNNDIYKTTNIREAPPRY